MCNLQYVHHILTQQTFFTGAQMKLLNRKIHKIIELKSTLTLGSIDAHVQRKRYSHIYLQ